jgi:hypothetical protein
VGLIAVDHRRSAAGYTLFTPQTDDGNVYLIDIDGAIAHRWKMPNRPGRHTVLLPNGNLGYNGSHPDSPTLYPMWSVWHGGAFAEVTPAGKTVWEFQDVTHHPGRVASQRQPALRRCGAAAEDIASQSLAEPTALSTVIVKEVNREAS